MTKIITSATKVAPPRVVVGPAYYYASGIVRSRTQLDRLRKAGRVTEFFNIGSRLGQWKDVADRDLALLIDRAARKQHVA
jgi:hypothetical protein